MENGVNLENKLKVGKGFDVFRVNVTLPDFDVHVKERAAKYEDSVKPQEQLETKPVSIINRWKSEENEILQEESSNINNSLPRIIKIEEIKPIQIVNGTSKLVLDCQVIHKSLGICGYRNSCYMDSTLMGLFMYDSSFMNCLNKNKGQVLPPNSETVRIVLKNHVCKPLNADKKLDELEKPMDTLRREMKEFKSVFEADQEDSEEFLSILFQEILKCPPFYRIDGGGDGHVFQTYGLPKVQYNSKRKAAVRQLLQYTFLDSNILLEDVPSPGLIIKMPVSNGQHLYSHIVPNLTVSMKKLMRNKAARNMKMGLSAVICLRHNHFTSFVRTNPNDLHSPWVYLDSLQHAQYRLITNLSEFLKDNSSLDYHQHELLDLLFGHCYMCVYIPI